MSDCTRRGRCTSRVSKSSSVTSTSHGIGSTRLPKQSSKVPSLFEQVYRQVISSYTLEAQGTGSVSSMIRRTCSTFSGAERRSWDPGQRSSDVLSLRCTRTSYRPKTIRSGFPRPEQLSLWISLRNMPFMQIARKVSSFTELLAELPDEISLPVVFRGAVLWRISPSSTRRVAKFPGRHVRQRRSLGAGH